MNEDEHTLSQYLQSMYGLGREEHEILGEKNLNYIDYWQDSLVTFGIDHLSGQENKLE